MSPYCVCLECGREIDVAENECPACHASLAAPNCPDCLQSVVRERAKPDAFNTPSWNENWSGECNNCGRQFRSVTLIRGGHHSISTQQDLIQNSPTSDSLELMYGHSRIEISGGESIHMEYDSWDHQPVIRINVQRNQSGNAGCDETRLDRNATIVLTVAECTQILRQLNGPLKVLMKRLPSWRDTT